MEKVFTILKIEKIERGKLYHIKTRNKNIEILITAHALKRTDAWGLKEEDIILALLYPE